MARRVGHSPIRFPASLPIDRPSRVGAKRRMLGKVRRNAAANAERFGGATVDEDEERERGENAADVRF